MGGLDQVGQNMRQIKHADSFAVVNPWEISEQLKAPSNMDMEMLFTVSYNAKTLSAGISCEWWG